MSSNRAKNALAPRDYEDLLRTNLRAWSSAYTSDDLEYVAKEYLALLQALASSTPRVSGPEIAAAAIEVFGVGDSEAKKFGFVMTSTFRAMRRKAYNCSSGKRQSQEVMSIIASFKNSPEKQPQAVALRERSPQKSPSKNISSWDALFARQSALTAPRRSTSSTMAR